MTTMYRYRWLLDGFTGAPGYTSFYSDPALVPFTDFDAFWAAVIDFFPTGTTAHPPTVVDEIEVETGEILGGIPAPGSSAHASGAPSESYAGMAGAFIDWSAAPARIHGRTVRGRTFLVPFTQSAMDTNGKLKAATQAAVQTAAFNLYATATPHLGIWARPFAGRGVIVRPGKPDLPAIPARVGTLNPWTGVTVPLMQATLRSRRT